MQGNTLGPTLKEEMLHFEMKYTKLVHKKSDKNVLASCLGSPKQIVGLRDESELHISISK